MEDRKLYIIGNGFDLHHGILSGYEHFKKFAQHTTSISSRLLSTIYQRVRTGAIWSSH